MIKAVFYTENGYLSGFCLSGHAGYGTRGNDVACAAVSSAVEFAINTVTEFFGDQADVEVKEDLISMRLKSQSCEYSYKVISSLHAHLGFILEEFPRSIKISLEEK